MQSSFKIRYDKKLNYIISIHVFVGSTGKCLWVAVSSANGFWLLVGCVVC